MYKIYIFRMYVIYMYININIYYILSNALYNENGMARQQRGLTCILSSFLN